MAASPISKPCLRLPFQQQISSSKRPAHRRGVIASIAVGDKIPDVKLTYFDVNGNMHEVMTQEFCAGQRVVIFGVPGAFLPTCSMKHVPGFVNLADGMKARGVDKIACVSVNDPFVMDAWGKALGADKLYMLADGNAEFAQAMRCSLDLTERGVGIRSRRYSLLADNGVVSHLHLEEGSSYTVSGADHIMADLEQPSS